MDVKAFLVRRGDAVAVALVALICMAVFYRTVHAPASLPEADERQIESRFDAVRNATSRQPPRPEPRRPADSLQAMRRRLAIRIPAPRVIQWLSRHPNIFAGEPPRNEFLYAYQILAPELALEAEVGSFQMRLRLPQSVGGSDPRVQGGGDWVWTRDVAAGDTVVNRVRVVAVEVQQKVGAETNPWEPVPGIGADGMIVLETAGGRDQISRALTEVQPMQDYRFRARLLTAATGHQAGDGVDRSVVMYRGRLLERPDWANFVQGYSNLKTDAPAGKDGAHLASPVEAQVPAGIAMEPNERLYRGPWSDEVPLTAESDVRFGLRSVSEFEGRRSARIWLRQMLRDPITNESLGWTEAGRDFVVAVGEHLGEKVIMTGDDGRRFEVDMTTDLVLKDIERDVERTYYYRVDLDRTEDGKRVLALNAWTRDVDIAVLHDQATNKEVRLIQLQPIRWRANDIICPQYPGDGLFHEQEPLEAADPTDYQAPLAPGDLRVDEPRWRAADDPLLWRYEPRAQTNQRYLEFKDGRLVYYDHINRQIYQVSMNQSALEPKADPEEGDGGADPDAQEAEPSP